jgi:hypothetical protein
VADRCPCSATFCQPRGRSRRRSGSLISKRSQVRVLDRPLSGVQESAAFAQCSEFRAGSGFARAIRPCPSWGSGGTASSSRARMAIVVPRAGGTRITGGGRRRLPQQGPTVILIRYDQ